MIHHAAAVFLIGVMAGQLVHGTGGQVGSAAHYRPGLMDQVARNRGMTPTRCDVAVTSDHRIGSWVTITRVKTGRSERCRITDVCAQRDCARLRARNIVAELSFDAARRLCGITHYGSSPPRHCIVSVR